MIQDKKDLAYYLNQDKLAMGIHRNQPKIIGDEIWKFEICLRKTEYYFNKKNLIGKFISKFYRLRLRRLQLRYGFSIPLNVFGPGLAIVHTGPIIVSEYASIGKNCRIQAMTVIGATNGMKKAPIIGDDVYISVGAKIIGDIRVGNGVAVGAGAVVVKDVMDGVTVGGVPAKVISRNGSQQHLIR